MRLVEELEHLTRLVESSRREGRDEEAVKLVIAAFESIAATLTRLAHVVNEYHRERDLALQVRDLVRLRSAEREAALRARIRKLERAAARRNRKLKRAHVERDLLKARVREFRDELTRTRLAELHRGLPNPDK